MRRTKRWLWLWRGTIYYGIALVASFGAGYFGFISARSTDDQTTFWGFVMAMICLLVAAVAGILASTYSLTKRERMYWRAEWRREDLEASGVPMDTWSVFSHASGAHSAGEERYRRGR